MEQHDFTFDMFGKIHENDDMYTLQNLKDGNPLFSM